MLPNFIANDPHHGLLTKGEACSKGRGKGTSSSQAAAALNHFWPLGDSLGLSGDE